MVQGRKVGWVVLATLAVMAAGWGARAGESLPFASESELVGFTNPTGPGYVMNPGEYHNSANNVDLTGNLILSNAETTLRIDPTGKTPDPASFGLRVDGFTMSAGRLEASGLRGGTLSGTAGLVVENDFIQTGGVIEATGGIGLAGFGIHMDDPTGNHEISGTVIYRNLGQAAAIHSQGNILFLPGAILAPVIDISGQSGGGALNERNAGLLYSNNMAFNSGTQVLPVYSNTHLLEGAAPWDSTSVIEGMNIINAPDGSRVGTLTIGAQFTSIANGYSVTGIQMIANASDHVTGAEEKAALDNIRDQAVATLDPVYVVMNDRQNNMRELSELQDYATGLVDDPNWYGDVRDKMDPNKLYNQMREQHIAFYDIAYYDMRDRMNDTYNYIGFGEDPGYGFPESGFQVQVPADPIRIDSPEEPTRDESPAEPIRSGSVKPEDRPKADAAGDFGSTIVGIGIDGMLGMSRENAFQWLLARDPQYLANFFAALTPEQIARLLALLTPEQIALFLAKVHPDTAALFLARVGADAVAGILAGMSAIDECVYQRSLTAAIEAEIDGRPKSEGGLVGLAIAIIPAFLQQSAGEVFGRLSGATDQYLANFFDTLTPELAQMLYAKLSPEQLAGLLARIHPDTAAEFFDALGITGTEAVLAAMPDSERGAYSGVLSADLRLDFAESKGEDAFFDLSAIQGSDILSDLSADRLNKLLGGDALDNESFARMLAALSRDEFNALLAKADPQYRDKLAAARDSATFDLSLNDIVKSELERHGISPPNPESENYDEELDEYREWVDGIVYEIDGHIARYLITHWEAISEDPALFVNQVKQMYDNGNVSDHSLAMRIAPLLFEDLNFRTTMGSMSPEELKIIGEMISPILKGSDEALYSRNLKHTTEQLMVFTLHNAEGLIGYISAFPAADQEFMVDSLLTSGSSYVSYNMLNALPADFLSTALQKLSPEQLGDIRDNGFFTPEQFNAIMEKAEIPPLTAWAAPRAGKRGKGTQGIFPADALASVAAFARTTPREPGAYTFWASPFYQQSSRTASSGKEKVSGGTVGLTRNLGNLALGGQLSYSRARSRSSASNSDSDTYGVTFTARFMNLFRRGESAFNPSVSFSAGYSHQKFDNDRVGNDAVYSAKPHSNLYRAGVSVNNTWQAAPRLFLTPSVSLDYSHIRQSSSREKGRGAQAMWTRDTNSDSFKPGVGLDIMYKATEKTSLTVRANYRYETLDRSTNTYSSFLGDPLLFFDSKGEKRDPSSGSIGAGVSHQFTRRVSANADYSMSLAERYMSHQFSAVVNILF